MRTLCVVGAVLVAAGALAVPPADAAAPTFTVRSVGTPNGPVALATRTNGAWNWKDTTATFADNCAASTATGSTTLGSGRPGAGLLTQTGSTYSGCVGGAGITIVPTQLSAATFNALSSSGGVTRGSLTGVRFRFDFQGQGCSWTVTGATDWSYRNSTGVLAIAPATGSGRQLTVTKDDCQLLPIAAGDDFQITANYAVTSPAAGLTITSP